MTQAELEIPSFLDRRKVTPKMGTNIVRYDEKFAADAETYSSEEHTSGMWVSTRGGILSFDEEPMPGNQMCVVILDALRENTFYGTKFDPDNMLPPICYAFGRSSDEMAPHESMQADLSYFQPQNEECSTCRHAEWGSGDTGRGKACQNRRRLSIIPAGFFVPKKGSRDFDLELFDDADHYTTADIAFMKLPVTSVKDWAKYVTQLSASLRRPPYAVITRVYIEPDPKVQYRVKFELIEEVPNDLSEIVIARHEEAMASIVSGYLPPSENPAKSEGNKVSGLGKRSQ